MPEAALVSWATRIIFVVSPDGDIFDVSVFAAVFMTSDLYVGGFGRFGGGLNGKELFVCRRDNT